MAAFEGALKGLECVDLILTITNLDTSGIVLAFTKDEFAAHCLDILHARSGMERHLWNGVIEVLELFYSRLALNQRGVYQETFAATSSHRPKRRRTNQWASVSNALSCPPPVPDCVLGLPPGTSVGTVIKLGECETSRSKDNQSRVNENKLLVEIMQGEGELLNCGLVWI